jgi:hypothetical protein
MALYWNSIDVYNCLSKMVRSTADMAFRFSLDFFDGVEMYPAVLRTHASEMFILTMMIIKIVNCQFCI